ncbi:MAG: thioredoxin domain-containing protein [Candidatus Eisenbacteria bacterium]|nr:thioredoxin domain-containing protein [Candidatus Eisenbacteria bacterium]
MPTTDTHGRKPNRLAREKSPYLLQHAYNPVDWHPWGGEAFDEARRDGKPIFLSIGYSTCHWCHVMERESFEDDSTAALLNASFVPIKVDREERPDVDRVYMTAAQAMGLGGGWPLNVFLTPDLKPFYGGTYFPPDARQGRPSFRQVLASVQRAWSEHRAEIERTGDNVLAALAGMSAPDSAAEEQAKLMEQAADYFARAADHRHGGFGGAPKFPSVVNLDFLLRWWSRAPEKRVAALELVTAQLDAMRAGGIHDHLGGGFHRYATDREWLVPHFEKMLYDQAQLAWAYLEGFQSTGRREYAGAARDIFAYVTRDLSSPEGGFCSAEDADSEGEEGKFYVWTQAGIEAVLPREEVALFAQVYGVTPHGNFERGATILSLVRTPDAAAKQFGLPEPEVERRLADARAKLLEARARRVRPHRDDKVLAAWNGLMISAFARGARVLDDPALRARAVRAAEFVWRTLWDDERHEMKRRWRDGEAAGAGQLGDYACVALGFLDLYQATFDAAWLERAVRVTEAAVARFWDEEHGGFFESPADDPSIKVRMKDGFDGAEIAGNSIAAWDLVQLGALLDRRDWQEKARRTLEYYARRLAGGSAAMPQMLVAMDAAMTPPRHVVIAGEPDAPDTRALVRAYDRRFLPRDVLLLAGGPGRKRLADLAPFTAALIPQGGRATAYVCVNYACRLPVTEPEKFVAQLDERPTIARERR